MNNEIRNQMNKYLAQLCFQIEIESKKEISFDIQWRFILADSKEDAIFLARELGLVEEQTFFNYQDKQVNWKFIGVPEIIEIPELNHGMEIISNSIEPIDSKEYARFIQLKSQDLALRISKKELTFHL